MKMLTGHSIKKVWLSFFEERGHKIEESASLIPINDPTLLWINSGVAALKGYFDGSKTPENPRLVNAQKCIRTNDIEHVGNTARHHTFFEMLGNFSIGDYFRDEIIPWAYTLLTSEEYYGMPVNQLYVTVYPDDQETKQKWLEVGIPQERIIESTHNFWEIGTGPCGPCTEIFFDRGSAFGEGDTSLIRDDIENDRYIEIWNIVFSQYNAKANLSREQYPELPSKNIDTGMGLERMACIIQGKDTNFETDLFFPLIKHISKLANKPYDKSKSFKIIADHIRTVVFAINDGATLSNEGRGYVLRRLLRRAVMHGRQLGIERPFLKELSETVVTMMEESHPMLRKTMGFTKQVVEKEEKKFLETLNQGEKILKELLKKYSQTIPGEDVFMLYDTYGIPVELTEEYAEQSGQSIDRDGFNKHMQTQKDRARNARKNIDSMKDQNKAFLDFKQPSQFVGYEQLEVKANVIKVFDEGIVTDVTPFYAESGGQVSDQGDLINNGSSYEVEDVFKLPNGQTLHVVSTHDIQEGDTVKLSVNENTRLNTMAHHSATHLLYEALRDALGSHVTQQGSLVGPDYLRFDFSHYELPSDEIILKIEQRVNQKIQANISVGIEQTTVEQAKKRGAIAEFGEKYGASVRVVDMNDTLDLCGGTHVQSTKDIERFAIVSVESKGSGIYRIVALVKDKVDDISTYLKGFDDNAKQLFLKATHLKKQAEKEGIDIELNLPKKPNLTGSYQDVLNRRKYLRQLSKHLKKLEKKFKESRESASNKHIEAYLKQVDNNRIIIQTDGYDANTVKTLADTLMDHLKEGFVFIANRQKDNVFLVCKSRSEHHAGNLVKAAAKLAGGGGGGRNDFAQAGAKEVDKIPDIIAFVKDATT